MVKLDLATFERVAALTLAPGEDDLLSAVIDPHGAFAYFGTILGRVVKLDLATFERVAALTPNPDQSGLGSAVIDPAGAFAYFGTATDPGRVVKVDLATFERVDALTLQPGEGFPHQAVIDPDGAFAYFGTATDPGRVVKIAVGSPASPWHAIGFHQPVGAAGSVFAPAPGPAPTADADTIWHTAKGGSTIPLTFNLYDGERERTSNADIAGFATTALTCPGNGVAADEVDFVTTGNTTLRYDTDEQQFVQNWKTPSVKKDAYYRATVTFADDSTLSAFFRLRK